MTPQEALTRVIEHREIFREEMLSLMRSIMSGEVPPTLIAAILIGLRVKKETIGEIAAAAEVMREFATHGRRSTDADDLVDIVRHGRRRRAHLQHLDRRDVRRARRPARDDRQARQPRGVEQVGQRRRARSARREHQSQARAGRAQHREDRRRLHVRAEPPQRDEARRAGAQGAGRQDASSTSSGRSPIRRARGSS